MAFGNCNRDRKAHDGLIIYYLKKVSLIEQITVKNLYHLGIVAGLINEIKIV
jgi:hypothetical protein